MSLIDEFLNGGHAEVDAAMGTETMVCDGQTFAVVWDDFSGDTDGGLGLEPQMQAQATAQPDAVTNPIALKNKRCTVNSVEFRIYNVHVGRVAIRFDLCSPHESR